MENHQKIAILDFGSQYTKLIARRIREQSVYSEILPFDVDLEQLRDPSVKGIILSGGPRSVREVDSPRLDPAVYGLGVPILGICYGQQLMCLQLGGEVIGAEDREYGRASLNLKENQHPLWCDMPLQSQVWMSHGDRLEMPPPGFEVIGTSENTPVCAMMDKERQLYGIQFHPEVSHTDYGKTLIANFLTRICGCRGDWKMRDYLEEAISEIRQRVGTDHVLLGLSGGVDSAVAAALIHKAIGNQLTCVFIDHGMMRKNEGAEVVATFREKFGVDLVDLDVSERFLSLLDGVADPERKRKIIGATFVEAFEEAAKSLPQPKFLAQGTLYPDVIESAHGAGPAQTIKTHHNVGGLPEKMKMKLLEPLRELFKDEVREVGRLLGLPSKIVNRHPFPGPGLAVRILGAIDRESIRILQEADAIFIDLLRERGHYDQVSQAFAVLLPVRTVGIMGDERTYERVVALRSVNTSDFMTADWSKLPYEFLAEVSTRIVNEVKGINRVVFDITSKPPGTIEWE